MSRIVIVILHFGTLIIDFVLNAGIIDVSQPYGPAWPVAGIALPFRESYVYPSLHGRRGLHVCTEIRLPLLPTLPV
jgi:hypothetical protein